MSDDSSEEKSLPASQKKLRDARNKGQVAVSKDFVSGLSLLLAVIVMFMIGERVVALLQQSIILSTDLQNLPLREAIGRMAPGLSYVGIYSTLPMLVAALIGAVVASVLMQQGFIFSLEPMIPKPEKLNPVTGIKNLFKKKSFVELIKSILKVMILIAAFVGVTLAALDSLVRVPVCGFSCVVPTFLRMAAIIIGIALIFVVVVGAVDIILQKALFADEMKMTETEAKKEREEQNGKPEIKGEQNRIRREAAEGFGANIDNATLVVFGPGVTVALRYIKGETGVPVVIVKGRDAKGGALLAGAYSADKAIFEDPVLADMLMNDVPIGKPVKREQFDRVARALNGARPPSGGT